MSELIVSDKALEAVIAVAEAQTAMSNGSKVFQDSLKDLVGKKNALDKAVATIKKARKELVSAESNLSNKQEELHALETKVDNAQKRADKSKAEVVAKRAELKGVADGLAEREVTLRNAENNFASRFKAFTKESEGRSDALTKREVAVAAREQRAERIAAAMVS